MTWRPLRFCRAAPLLRLAAAAGVGAFATASARDARAWYFPEHVVIAHDGLMRLPPEIREVIKDAVARARADGLDVCGRVDVLLEEIAENKPLSTRMLLSEVRVDCVPYEALPALAGDHASSAAELRTVLTTPKGIEITSAVAYEWRRYKEAVERERAPSLERMSFVHELDVAFYFIDPGYELRAQKTHAHFVDAGRPMETLLAATERGDADDSLSQFLAHHIRSLERAARGDTTEAILEHAFALHFLEDAFAAGHLVMTEATWAQGNAHVRQRHDFYNARGLLLRRALSAESCDTLGSSSLELSGLTPCWMTTGDGYLGASPDASDRLHAARAVTKAELEFALAIDSHRVVAAAEAFGEREQITLGQLVDPVPWWTVKESQRRDLRESPSRTLRLVQAAAVAVEHLRTDVAPMPAIEVSSLVTLASSMRRCSRTPSTPACRRQSSTPHSPRRRTAHRAAPAARSTSVQSGLVSFGRLPSGRRRRPTQARCKASRSMISGGPSNCWQRRTPRSSFLRTRPSTSWLPRSASRPACPIDGAPTFPDV